MTSRTSLTMFSGGPFGLAAARLGDAVGHTLKDHAHRQTSQASQGDLDFTRIDLDRAQQVRQVQRLLWLRQAVWLGKREMK